MVVSSHVEALRKTEKSNFFLKCLVALFIAPPPLLGYNQTKVYWKNCVMKSSDEHVLHYNNISILSKRCVRATKARTFCWYRKPQRRKMT